MRLTVLGGCGGWPAAGLAAAGSYPGEIAVASPGLVAEPGARGE